MKNLEHISEEIFGFGLTWKSTVSINTFPLLQ